MILCGPLAFYLEKQSSQFDALEQENKTLNDDDYENQRGNGGSANEILTEIEIVLKCIPDTPHRI